MQEYGRFVTTLFFFHSVLYTFVSFSCCWIWQLCRKLCVEKDLYFPAKRNEASLKKLFKSMNSLHHFAFALLFGCMNIEQPDRSQSNIVTSHDGATRCQKCQRIDSPRLDLRTRQFFPCHSPLSSFFGRSARGSPMSIATNQLQGFFGWETIVWLAWRTLCFLRGRDGCHYT